MSDDKSSKTTSRAEVELIASVPKRTVVQQPFDLVIVLRNNRSSTIYWDRQVNSWRDWYISIVDAKGKECPMTPEGEKLIGKAPFHSYFHVRTPIEPKKSHTWTLDLPKCFRFTPGKYRVSVNGIVQPNAFEIEARNVEFEIIEGKPKPDAEPSKPNP